MPGLTYTNYRIARGPWSAHVAMVARPAARLELHSAHAGGGALGLSTLTEQIKLVNPALGTPVAAVNGDFYQRDKAYAGDPRGLQIVDGEVISAPSGGVTFWIAATGRPYATNVTSRFAVTWSDGVVTHVGLNEERQANAAVLYTPAVGASTHTVGGHELTLERVGETAWLPLRMGESYVARVRETREAGDTPLAAGVMVLSLGPALAARLPAVTPGALVKLTTSSAPGLWGVRTALSGGPMLVHNGKVQKVPKANSEAYQFSSMFERHPRSAVGWNGRHFFLVEVDGRQKTLSVGMTLEELAAFMIQVGCQEAMNLDGGGSATLWCQGKVRNKPCDGYERVIANSLVVVQKPE